MKNKQTTDTSRVDNWIDEEDYYVKGKPIYIDVEKIRREALMREEFNNKMIGDQAEREIRKRITSFVRMFIPKF